jgi:hypothetical protein
MIALRFTLPAPGQTTSPQSKSTSQAVQSEEETLNALYQKFLDSYATDQPTAYKVATECLKKHPEETDQTKYLKRWVYEYDARVKMARKRLVRELTEEERFNEAFALGKDILASEPEDVDTLINLVDVGLGALGYGNNAFIADASNYAKRALRLLEVDQAPDENERKTLGWLNRSLGILSLTSAPAESAVYFYKALQFEVFKSDAVTYAFLADAILGAQYTHLQREYARFTTPEQKASAEAGLIRVKLNLAADQIIDALARAVALAGSDVKLLQPKAMWMDVLTTLYKFRNSGYDTGLSEYLEGILKRPWAPQLMQH